MLFQVKLIEKVDINARKNKIFSAKNSLFLTDLSSKWWRIYASVELGNYLYDYESLMLDIKCIGRFSDNLKHNRLMMMSLGSPGINNYAPLQIGNSVKGKNLLPEEENSFL